MSQRRARSTRRIAAVTALLVAGTLATACDSGTRTTVITQPVAEETTGTLTALERGEIRRDALDVVREGIEAWLESDADAMRTYFADDLVAKFETAWAPYEAKGQRIEHVHEVDYLDVVDLNKAGTQALVTYRYDDRSYVVDSAGEKVEDLPVFELKEIQFTLQLQGDTWKVLRAIAGEDAYR